MTERTLKLLVQQLGQLRARATELQGAERDLTAKLRGGMTELKLTAVEARDFTAEIAERQSLVIDPVKFKRAVKPAIFLDCLKICPKAVRRHFPDGELNRFGKFVKSEVLRISRRPTKGKRT